jgi:hypothetical protein
MNTNIKFKLPRNIISNNVVKNVLYLITLALAVSYIINEQNLALISLIIIACGVYILNKSLVIALFISIIITNLLLSMNYFENISIIENIENSDNCCNGATFYTSNLLNYNAISENVNNKNTCTRMETDISAHLNTISTNDTQKARFFSMLYSNNNYAKATSICNTMDPSSSTYNIKGTLFKKSETNINVLESPNTLPKDILDIIAFSNIRNNLNSNDKNILEKNIIEPLQIMNGDLIAYTRQNNLQVPITISYLTNDQISQLTSIKTILLGLYNTSNTPLTTTTKKDTTYTLIGKNNSTNTYEPITNNGTQYILNIDQFFDCSGVVQNSNSGTLSASDIIDLSNNNYFGTSGRSIIQGGLGDASYNPYGTLTQADLYPSNKDLEMELRRLETIPSSGNAPVNIISTYLNAINSFYEKQIQNLTGLKSNTFTQDSIEDIYSIKTKKPTFFTYDNTYNNEYRCEDSITGNSAFKYCGPSAYYEIPKF